MDISKLDVVTLSNKGFNCVIKHPKTGADTDLVICIKGVYAENFRDECDKADTAEKTATFLSRFTLGWENMERDGAPVEFNLKTAEQIYLDYPIIRSQVLNAALNVANFTKD